MTDLNQTDSTAPAPAPITGIVLDVNGVAYPTAVGQNRTLLGVIRNEVGLTGTKEGCDTSECGACMVLIDGKPVNSCSYLAVQAQGSQITTVEGLASGTALSDLQTALLESGGVQCGFCTPGMLMSAKALLDENSAPTREEIRIGLSGNLCRCTGYAKIIDAVSVAAVTIRSGSGAETAAAPV